MDLTLLQIYILEDVQLSLIQPILIAPLELQHIPSNMQKCRILFLVNFNKIYRRSFCGILLDAVQIL